MLNIIIALIIAGLFLTHFKRNTAGIVLIGLSIILYFAIASAVLPDYLMSRLQSPYSSQLQSPLEDNTAFIVFGMGTQTIDERGLKKIEPLAFSYSTIFAAVAMNHQCVKKGFHCKFIVSGADVGKTGVSEARSIAAQLEKSGVDPASILVDENSINTWENSRNTSAILREVKPAKTVLLQAAPMITRSLLYLAHFGMKPEPLATAYLTGSHTNLSSPGLYFFTMDVALHEEVGMLRYAMYNFLGWNAPKQAPLELGQTPNETKR